MFHSASEIVPGTSENGPGTRAMLRATPESGAVVQELDAEREMAGLMTNQPVLDR